MMFQAYVYVYVWDITARHGTERNETTLAFIAS